MKIKELNKAILINHLIEMYEIETLIDDFKIYQLSKTLFASVCIDEMNPSTFIYSIVAGEVELQEEFHCILNSYNNYEFNE